MIYNFENKDAMEEAIGQVTTIGGFMYQYENLRMFAGDIFAVNYEAAVQMNPDGTIGEFKDNPDVVFQVVQIHFQEESTIGIFPCTKDGIRQALLLNRVLNCYDEDGDCDTAQIREFKLGTNLDLEDGCTFYYMQTWKFYKGAHFEGNGHKLDSKYRWKTEPFIEFNGMHVRHKMIEDVDACDCHDRGWHDIWRGVYRFPNGEACTWIEYERTIVAMSLEEAQKIAEESAKEYFDTHPADPEWEPVNPTEYLDDKYWEYADEAEGKRQLRNLFGGCVG